MTEADINTTGTAPAREAKGAASESALVGAVALSADAVLFALCAELMAGQAKWKALCDPWQDTIVLEPRESREQRAGSIENYHALRARIAAIPAESLAGMRAKARIALMEIQAEDGPPDEPTQVVWSLCRDVLRAEVG